MAGHLDYNAYGYTILFCGWIFAVLGAVAVGLRIWSRWLRKQSLMLNDWFAVTALVSALCPPQESTVLILIKVFNIALISHTTYGQCSFRSVRAHC